ncbi:hypothetical protein, partial [Lactococcus petauri]|uniref:hypothetical protein n=1 Tax=Lactococcus petauri TaxID=1940789 RepID=UPI0021F21320
PKAPDRLQTIIGPSWWIRGYTYRAPPESSLINSIFEAWRNSGDPRELKTDVESHNHTGDLEGSYDSQSLRDDTTTIRAVVKK